ncbi:transcriptional regulator ArgP [Pseudonocardia sulfidoxydans NBRC 16205]|uniref:Transcriptional regulator ArgP n=1 Tax=Pseudonocardia sulfidoxydans NBRC 16205 TaxID=1223511 RepID=A0A511DP84_9PSEU|nr:LysR family transcriptional regulator ArgP [Pseudonocardia sulfidoxydans]GEL26631.1 transcriptional regulator ArgP [Pseudonocardia sulfidoxydans NBRC 16205]
MRLPHELVETVATIVDEGTFEAAATRLHLTPSAVSQRVRRLEDQLGRILLVRSKPVRPTEAGAAIVRLARQTALLEHEALGAVGDGERTSLPLAVNADSLGTWFLAPLARVAQRYPVVFELHRDDQDFTAGLLADGTVTAAVTAQGTPVAGCAVSPLGVMRYDAVATPEFVARWFPDGITPEAVARAPLVDYDRRDDLQTRWLRARGADPAAPPRNLVPASNDFATAVRMGLGWGLLMPPQSRGPLAAGELVGLGGPPVTVPLFWQRWRLRSPLLDAVAAEVAAEAARALDQPRPANVS